MKWNSSACPGAEASQSSAQKEDRAVTGKEARAVPVETGPGFDPRAQGEASCCRNGTDSSSDKDDICPRCHSTGNGCSHCLDGMLEGPAQVCPEAAVPSEDAARLTEEPVKTMTSCVEYAIRGCLTSNA